MRRFFIYFSHFFFFLNDGIVDWIFLLSVLSFLYMSLPWRRVDDDGRGGQFDLPRKADWDIYDVHDPIGIVGIHRNSHFYWLWGGNKYMTTISFDCAIVDAVYMITDRRLMSKYYPFFYYIQYLLREIKIFVPAAGEC